MVAALPILGAAALAGGGLYLATRKDSPPEVQSSKHLSADGTPVQVIVPTDAPMPRPSVTQVPIAGHNATIIATSGTGKRYVPPAVVKSLQTPGKLDLLPTVITPTGASSLAVMTVADIQNALNTVGCGPLDVDGKVGTRTTAAIKKFQESHGLQVDGIAGKNTMRQLQDALANMAAPPAKAAIGAHPVVTSAVSGTPAKVAAASNAAVGIASLAGANQRTQQTIATAGSVATNVAALFSWDPPHSYGEYDHHGRQGYGRPGRQDRYPGYQGAAQGYPGQGYPGQGYPGRGYPGQGYPGQVQGGAGTPNVMQKPGFLMPGEFLQPSLDQRDHMIGRGGKTKLVFQTDGNLVLYGPGKQSIWSAGTNGRGSMLRMDDNGNLAIYDTNNSTVWTANTANNPGAYLRFTGNDAVIMSPQGSQLWSARNQGQSAAVSNVATGAMRRGPFGAVAPSYGGQYSRSQGRGQGRMTSGSATQGQVNQLRNPSRMGPGETLQPQLDGQNKTVGRGACRLVFQTDGNLVLYGPNNAPIWASGTNRSGISRLTMQADGNLAIYDNSSRMAWSTGTTGHPGAYLEVTARDAVVRDPRGGAVLWSAARQGNQGAQSGQPSPMFSTRAMHGFGAERVGVTEVVRPVQSVREVQESLNFLGASPPLLVDGRMGKKTAAAIKVFQVTHGMLADGFAGPKTLTAMTIAVAENQRPFAKDSDFGLTLFTLFGGDKLPGVGRSAEFGRSARGRSSAGRRPPSGGGRPAPPTGQMVSGQFVPAGGGAAGGGHGHHRHHHKHKDQDQDQQQPPPDPGGGAPSGGGAGDAGGGAAAAPPPVPMDVSSAPVDDGSGGASDAPDPSSDDSPDGADSVGFG